LTVVSPKDKISSAVQRRRIHKNTLLQKLLFSLGSGPSLESRKLLQGASSAWTKEGISYKVIERDELDENGGNDSRATIGMLTKRTSVHSTFIKGKPIGGLNGGTPGLLPLAESGQLISMFLM
jgi:hypothetical protein